MVEKLSFNLSNFVEQEFPFPVKLIEYINEESDAEIKQKLDRCCKYFYKELPFLIVDILELFYNKQRIENETYGGCLDFIDDNEIEMFLKKIDNIWVIKNINNYLCHNLFKAFIDKVSRYDTETFYIFELPFPYEIIKFLSKCRNVDSFYLSSNSLNASDRDESRVPLEDVLALVPNVRSIRIDESCHVTDETITKLLEIPWKNKLIWLSLSKVDGPVCVDLFFKFVKKHLSPHGQIDVDFTFENKEFEKLYNQKVIDSGEIMPTLGTFKLPVKKETPVIPFPPPVKKQTWVKSFLDLFCCCFRKKPSLITEDEPLHNGHPEDELMLVEEPMIVEGLMLAEEQILIDELMLADEDEPKVVEDSAPMKKVVYTNENIERQYTAFPYPHMCYIRENADGETWKKLEQTCKFFHEKNPYLMLDDLHVKRDGRIKVMVDNKKMKFENGMEIRKKLCKPLWIINSLNFLGRSLFFPARNEAKKISLSYYNLSMDLFKDLTNSGMIKEWNGLSATIKSDDGKVISLKELLFYLPNAEIIRAKISGINHPNTNEPIILLENNKIKELDLQFLDEPINADLLFDVLAKSLAPKARVELDFKRLVNVEMDLTRFKAQLKSKLDTWKPQIERPTINIDV